MAETRRSQKRRKWTRWKTALVACALSLGATTRALAGQPEAEHAAAVQSFRQGTQLVEAGRIEDAIKAFREALQHEPSSVGARLDLADCYEKIGSPASAWREYALAEGYAHKAGDHRQEMARLSLAHLEASLLLLTLSGERVTGAELNVDGDPIAEEIVARGALGIAPGRHRIALRAPGKKPLAWEVTGGAGETRTLVIRFAAEPVAHAAPATASPTRKTSGIALGIVGLAGIALGSIAGAIALSDRSSLEREAHDSSVGSARFYADRSTADTFATVSTAAFIAGGVALAAGVSVYFWPAPTGPGVTIAGTF